MANGTTAMAAGDVSAAWRPCLDVIEKLYKDSIATLVRGQTAMRKVPAKPVVDAALKCSDQLGAATAANLNAKGSEQRELAMVQLLAAATVDFGIAHDLARHGEIRDETLVGPEPFTDPAAFSEPGLGGVLGEAIPVLEAPPAEGLWTLIVAGGAPSEPASPSEELTAAADSALIGIRDEAGETATVTLGNPLEALAGLPLQAADKTVGELVGLVDGAISWVLRKAVAFVLKGIAKLLAVFGSKANAVRAKVAEWADSALGENAVVGLLDRLYRTKPTSAELSAMVAAAPPSKEAQMRAATGDLEKLETKFRRQMQAIAKVAKVVGKISPWLLALVSPVAPWGPLIVATAYTATTGYLVFAGGDYIDWPNQTGGLLDLVYGVRSMVEDAVGGI